ncbi:MAG: delta-60 repeat domain-containing protein [Pirellula sp.]
MAIQSDGSIIVAGIDRQALGVTHPFLMRFFGSTPSPYMAFSSHTISNDSNRPSELTREAPIAEVMYDLGHDQVVEEFATTRVVSQSVANVFDRAPLVDLPASETEDVLTEELLEVITSAQLALHV